MAQFHKGDKLEYYGNYPYILGDGQKVDRDNTEVTLKADFELSHVLFGLAEPKAPEVNIDAIHEKALIDNQVFDSKKAKADKKGE
jgi:hypothetical protein